MHEITLMTGLMESCQQQAKKVNAKKITVIKLRIGERSGVVLDALEFAFDVVSKDTLAEGASLVIEKIPCQGECLECQTIFEPTPEGFMICDQCGAYGRLIQGQELQLTSIDVET